MKISVALCTYNGEKFLQQQLDSILNQSHNVDEVIICDDKSTDGTINLIQAFLKKHPDKITLYENERDLGPIKNFEKCIEGCSGDIIFLSDQDDVWYRNKVQRMVDLFKRDEKALMIFSNGDLIDDNGNMLPGSLWEKWGFTEDVQTEWLSNKKAFSYLIRNNNKITGATVAFKKELKRYLLPFEFPKNYWHDTWLGIVASGFNGLRFDVASTIKYRVHNNQQIGVGNGISITTGDPTFGNTISTEEFLIKLCKKYPEKSRELFPAKNGIIRNAINKIRFLLKNVSDGLNLKVL